MINNFQKSEMKINTQCIKMILIIHNGLSHSNAFRGDIY